MKDGGRASTRAEPAAREPAKARPAAPVHGSGLPNTTIAHHVRGGGSVAGFPGAPLDNQQAQRRGSLPHRTALEQSFGRSLGHLDVRTGAGELGAFGAQALAMGNKLTFRDAAPSASIVAHEVTHALQSERGSSSGGLVAPRGSAAESEADTFASAVAQRGAGARLPRVSARPAGQVHFAPPAFGATPTADQEDLLRQWILADAPPAQKKFDPSLTQFAQPPRFQQSPGMPSTFDPDQAAEIAKWIKATDPPQADPAPGSDSTHSAPPATPGSHALTDWPTSFPTTPMTGFPSNAHKSDPFAAQGDLFKPKVDPSICNVGCHGVQYQRMAPAAPAAPAWSAPDMATGQAAVAKEAQTADDTADQIDLQVLSAKAAAISAAAASGKLPADLQSLWQAATLSAEALRISAPALARAKPGDALPPPPPATPPPAGTTAPAPEVDAAAAEAARTAIDAFYWSLVDALQVKEADDAAFADRWNSMRAKQETAAPACPGSCHAGPSDSFSFKFIPMFPPDKQSRYVTAREKTLKTATSVEQWKGALDDFDVTSTKQLEGLLTSILPADSKELSQLAYATALRERVRELQGTQSKAIRIPAVFYPKDDLSTETGPDGKQTAKANGYSWYLFLYQQPDGVWVLKDLTSNQIFTNKEGGDAKAGIESWALTSGSPLIGNVPPLEQQYPAGVLTDLMGQLDSKLHMPKGELFYTLPGGRQRSLETKAEDSLSDWLFKIGLTLAAIGLVALTAGAGTPAALAFVGAGLVGAAATKTQLEEMEAQGIATDSDRARAYVTMAIDLVGALAGGLGMIARAPSMFGQLAVFADRVYVPVRALALGGDVVQAALMTHDFVTNLQALAAQPDSSERSAGIVKLIAMGLAMGALSYVSIKGGVHELSSGARPRVAVNEDGSYSLVGKGGVPVPEGSGGWKFQWKATVAATVEDPALGKSAVVDIERDANGLVVGVGVRRGPGTTKADIQLHEDVAATVSKYGGAQGRIRNLWREVLAKFGFRRPPLEVELEIWKLEQAANLRMKTLSSPGVSEAQRLDAERELDTIEHNLERARKNATAALAKPPETPAQRAQIWMKEHPDELPPPPPGTQWVRNEAGRWDLVETGARGAGAEVRAVYGEQGEFVGLSNRAQVQRTGVIGRRLGEVQERLEGMGYTVETTTVDGVTTTVIKKPAVEGAVDLVVDPISGTIKGPAGAGGASIHADAIPGVGPKYAGYSGEWPPPAEGPRPGASSTVEDRVAWRYKRYAHGEYLKGKAANDIMSPEAHRPYGLVPETPGARPGRPGGPGQRAVREGPMKAAGYDDVENVQLGERYDAKLGRMVPNMVDGLNPVRNAAGGVDYSEVDEILKNGLPSAALRPKLKAEIQALKPNDTLVYWDKNWNGTGEPRTIRYEYGDDPGVVDTRVAPTVPRKPRTPKG